MISTVFSRYLLSLIALSLLLSCSSTTEVQQPQEDSPSTHDRENVGVPEITDLQPDERPIKVDQMLDTLSLRQKIGQLFMVRVSANFENNQSWGFERLIERVKDGKVGGLMVSNGHTYETARNIQRMQAASPAPLLVGADFEWGLPMRLSGGTRFPENMAIGATRNPEYAYQQGEATAEEARAMGVHMNFAPVMDVNNNPDNPIINIRSYGGTPELVSEVGSRYIEGLQKHGVAATAKHFPGHGDTDVDSHLRLPSLPFDRQRLNRVELKPFEAAIESDVKAVMAAHVAMSAFPTGERPATLSPYMIQNVLRDSLGYDGVVVTDAMTMGGIQKGYWPGEAVVKALKAGVDLMLLPTDFELSYRSVVEAVEEGRLSEERVNASVRRVLQLKKYAEAGTDYPDLKEMEEHIEDPTHQIRASRMFKDAITLVKDSTGNIPLSPATNDSLLTVIVTDDMSYGYPGGSFQAQLSHYFEYNRVIEVGPQTADRVMESALEKAKEVDAVAAGVFVRFGSYKGHLNLPDSLVRFMEKLLQSETPVATVGFGSPYLLRYFPSAETYLTTYSASRDAQSAAVQALIGQQKIAGKLPVMLPSGYEMGHGLEREKVQTSWTAAETAGRFDGVREMVREAIRDSVAPGMAVYAARDGEVFMNEGFGHFTYDEDSPQVTSETIYDLASLTKVMATAPIAMKMYEQNLLHLDKPVHDYIPQFSGKRKDSVTVRQVLNHTAGMKPYVRFWKKADDPDEVPQMIYDMPVVRPPGKEYHYSDPGFILMQQIIEKLGGAELDELAQRNFYNPLEMDDTMFNPDSSLLPRIPPTEYDEAYRGELVRGEVHDENAAFLGGVAGHAGLFSTTGDLGSFAQMLLSNGYFNGRKYFENSTIREFTEPQLIDDSSTRALGWDTPSAKNSLYGSETSGQAFGHFGFTGTSILIDPKYETIVILLSNRVYPTRTNKKINEFRPKFHDAVMEALKTQ